MPHFINIKNYYINIDHIIQFYCRDNILHIVTTELTGSTSKDTGYIFKDSKECFEKLEILNRLLATYSGCSVTVI